jgi:hypothetical protein
MDIAPVQYRMNHASQLTQGAPRIDEDSAIFSGGRAPGMRRNQLPSSNLVRQENLLINHINQVLGTIFSHGVFAERFIQTTNTKRPRISFAAFYED